MGNLCGKQSKEDNFEGPGRVLGSAPQPASNAKASIPARVAGSQTQTSSPKAKVKVGGPARTIGAGEGGSKDDPRSAAAAAAEARANKTPTGDLAKKLDAQKRQTQNQALQSAASENVAHRQADAATETRNYN